MYFKSNLIIVLVVVNLLLLFFLLSKRETFFNKAAIIDSSIKNKVKIDSNLLLDATDPKETGKKNAQLFIDGNVRIGPNVGVEPQICFGNECYSSKKIKDFLKYKIPYEVFETDPVKQETPDRLCFKDNCITGDDLKIINGEQPVYIAGPKDDPNQQPYYQHGHIKFKLGPAPHYYYDINENYYEQQGNPHKHTLLTNFTHPDCVHHDNLYNESQSGNYHGTGFDQVPYFYNLDYLKGSPWGGEGDAITLRAYNTRKDSADIDGDSIADGILQMIKQPVHKKRGVDYDHGASHQHQGHFYDSWDKRCDWDNHTNGSGKAHTDFQLMNISAVNLMPKDFSETNRDKIRYKLKPGDETGLKCLTT